VPLMVIAYAAIHHRCGDKEIIGISGTWERSHVHTILITCHFSSVHEFGTKHTGFFLSSGNRAGTLNRIN
jgi:hypothetical protein